MTEMFVETEITSSLEESIRSEYPILEVRSPDGQKRIIRLDKNCINIGRSNSNDIVLAPDSQKNVSRCHCNIERDDDGYWKLRDKESANNTFIRRGNSLINVQEYGYVRRLRHGDVILILGNIPAEGEPIFWELTFQDPGDITNQDPRDITDEPPPPLINSDYLEYKLKQQILVRVTGQNRKEIDLTPNEHNMVHYMAVQNQTNNGEPVMCKYKDLIEAIWGEPLHTKEEVNHLVWRLRQKIEQESGNPNFLRTVSGRGYLLEVRVLN